MYCLLMMIDISVKKLIKLVKQVVGELALFWTWLQTLYLNSKKDIWKFLNLIFLLAGMSKNNLILFSFINHQKTFRIVIFLKNIWRLLLLLLLLLLILLLSLFVLLFRCYSTVAILLRNLFLWFYSRGFLDISPCAYSYI